MRCVRKATHATQCVAWRNRIVHNRGMTNDEIIAYRDALAARLRSVAAGRGLEQANLAARMKALGYTWHRQTVSAVFQGSRRITAEEILGLSIALETSISELMAPLTNSSRGKFVGLPNGAVVTASEVSGSAGAGIPGGFIRWEGDNPIFPSNVVLDALGDLPDTTANIRAAMERGPATPVMSDEELRQEATRMIETVLPELLDGVGKWETRDNESAAERNARRAKDLEKYKRELPGQVADIFEQMAAEQRAAKEDL